MIKPGRARPASWLGKLLPRRLDLVAGVALTLTAAAGAIAIRFLLNDPFESNFRNLRSQSADIARAQGSG